MGKYKKLKKLIIKLELKLYLLFITKKNSKLNNYKLLLNSINKHSKCKALKLD